MRKLTTAILVLSLVLGGVALAIAADAPQTPQNVELSKFQKLTDKEAQEIKGTYMGSANMFGYQGTIVCPNSNCVPVDNNYNYNKLWGTPPSSR